MFDNHFWEEFWPQFAAGVASGVALALLTVGVTYVSRRKIRRTIERYLGLLRK